MKTLKILISSFAFICAANVSLANEPTLKLSAQEIAKSIKIIQDERSSLIQQKQEIEEGFSMLLVMTETDLAKAKLAVETQETADNILKWTQAKDSFEELRNLMSNATQSQNLRLAQLEEKLNEVCSSLGSKNSMPQCRAQEA
jgi:hypothetical protein